MENSKDSLEKALQILGGNYYRFDSNGNLGFVDTWVSDLWRAQGIATDLSKKFTNINIDLENSWNSVADFAFKIDSQARAIIVQFVNEISKFIEQTNTNESDILTTANKTNDAAQQILNELGLNGN